MLVKKAVIAGAVSLLFAGGCRATAAVFEPPIGSPANPKAEEAPRPQVGACLLESPARASADGVEAHHHGSHDSATNPADEEPSRKEHAHEH